jgi:hypothetical protein
VVVVLSISLFSVSTSRVVLRVAPLCVCVVRVPVAPELVWLTDPDPLARCPCQEAVLPDRLAEPREVDTDPREPRCASGAAIAAMTNEMEVTATIR